MRIIKNLLSVIVTAKLRDLKLKKVLIKILSIQYKIILVILCLFDREQKFW